MRTIRFVYPTFLVILITIAIVLSGCAPKPASTMSPSGIQDGTYVIDNNKLKFQGNHYTVLTTYDQEVSQGSFLVTGNRIQFTEQDFAPECGAQDSPYSYQWSFDGKALTFSNPDDKCLGRITFMTNTPWVLISPTP